MRRNHSIITEYVFDSIFHEIKTVKCIQEKIHEDHCNCDHHKFALTMNSKNEKRNAEIANNTFQNVSLKKLNANETEIEIVTSYSAVRRKFHSMYEEVFPSPSEYINLNHIITETIFLLFYQLKNEESLKYEFLNSDDIHEFCKINKSKIKESLLVRNKQLIWSIIGTGCSCSQFSPLPITVLDKTFVQELICEESINYKMQLAKQNI